MNSEMAFIKQVPETADCLKTLVKYTKNKPLSGRSVLVGGYSYVEGNQEVTRFKKGRTTS